MQATRCRFHTGFLLVVFKKLRAVGLILLAELLLFLFHVLFELRHDILHLVRRQLRFTGNGVFHACVQDIGINVHLLASEVKSDLHPNRVADLVSLVFELW